MYKSRIEKYHFWLLYTPWLAARKAPSVWSDHSTQCRHCRFPSSSQRAQNAPWGLSAIYAILLRDSWFEGDHRWMWGWYRWPQGNLQPTCQGGGQWFWVEDILLLSVYTGRQRIYVSLKTEVWREIKKKKWHMNYYWAFIRTYKSMWNTDIKRIINPKFVEDIVREMKKENVTGGSKTSAQRKEKIKGQRFFYRFLPSLS